MSDFLYTREAKQEGELAGFIRDIYHCDPPEVREFHGEWGSLAVSRNLYRGFEPYETESRIFVVVGGPVLTFRDNRFLTGDDPVAGTVSVFERFQSGKIRWDEDLSGPFAVLMVDKAARIIRCVTDLMLFIPVYQYTDGQSLALGTHVDALAKAAGQQDAVDKVSLVDFILNRVVTFPYTTYTHLRQCHPAAIQEYKVGNEEVAEMESELYWTPVERTEFTSLNEASGALRAATEDYITRVTEGMDRVGLFLSGGEDSRTVAAMLPERLKKDGFIFLDSMNREGQLARKAAGALDVDLTVKLRKVTHYLDILPEASDLIGSGRQCVHAHTLGFHKECRFDSYDAVFGGYFGETILRAYDACMPGYLKRFPFLPETTVKGKTHSEPMRSRVFRSEVLESIDRRRQEFLDLLREYRSESVHEWFQFWPRTMGYSSPNTDVNRRLFRSYEPFTSSAVIRIGASVPTAWKLNRKLFRKAFWKYHRPSKWIPHSRGYLPFFPWWFNVPVAFTHWFLKKVKRRLRGKRQFDGPWIDWETLKKTDKWNDLKQECYTGGLLEYLAETKDVPGEPEIRNELRNNRMANVFQVNHIFNKQELANRQVTRCM